MAKKDIFAEIRNDLPAGLAVFFVSIPLCLGIALASGAPLISGLIGGVVGGVLGGLLSRAPLSVSGPAAGMAAVALYSISQLGSFGLFLIAVILAGIIQVILGLARAGVVGRFFPVSVINGMMAGIGLILVLKQIPHALGYDVDFEGDQEFFQKDNENTFSEIIRAFESFTPGSIFIAAFAFGMLVLCASKIWQSNKWVKMLPGPLVAVVVGIMLNEGFQVVLPQWELRAEHLVDLPPMQQWTAMPWQIPLQTLSIVTISKLAMIAVTVALVASLETLLNIEAIDKLDPFRRTTPLNRELIAQGTTNIASGLLGGLPVTAVIIRSSLNINAGARTQLSTITQGLLIAVSVLMIPEILEAIPLASLAVILIVTGYKLAPLSLWKSMYKKGIDQFVPFVATALIILFSNLLIGILLGLLIALFFVLKSNFRLAILKVNRDGTYLVKFTKDVSFLNKALLYRILSQIPDGSQVYIDGTRAHFIDHDIIDMLEDYQKSAPIKNITVEIVRKNFAVHPFFKTESE